MAQSPNEVTGRGTPTLAAKAPSSAVTIEEIRSRIVETRAEMTETIDALQERLSPGRLMTHATETVKEAIIDRMKHLAQKVSTTAGDFARETTETRASVVHRVKNNPVPVALVGVAATWLLVRALRRPRTEADKRAKHGAERHGGRGGTNMLTGTVRNNARFLIGAGASVACWGIWKAQNSVARFPAIEQSHANAVDAVRSPFRAA